MDIIVDTTNMHVHTRIQSWYKYTTTKYLPVVNNSCVPEVYLLPDLSNRAPYNLYNKYTIHDINAFVNERKLLVIHVLTYPCDELQAGTAQNRVVDALFPDCRPATKATQSIK